MTVETLFLIFVGLFCIMGTLYFGFRLAIEYDKKNDIQDEAEQDEVLKTSIVQSLNNIEYYISKKEDK